MRLIKTNGKRKWRGIVLLVLAGFAAGLFLVNAQRKVLLDNTGFLGEYMLFEMKYSKVDSGAFFWYVLQKRVGLALIIAVLSTTWLGLTAVWAGAVWIGMSFGMLVMTALLRYGLKGILLVAVGIFPQAFLYFPAALMLLQWSRMFCTLLYYPERYHDVAGVTAQASEKGVLMRKLEVRYLLLLLLVIAGCLLESHINPILVFGLLKIF